MFNIGITVLIIVLPIICIGFGYALYPRATKNILMKIIPSWYKRYVICHMMYPSGLSDTYLVVPNPEGLTKVGRNSYMLKEEYSILKYKKRLHYILQEDDVVPVRTIPTSRKDLIFQSAEIQTALDNTVMTYLFKGKAEIILYVVVGLVILNIFIIAYVLMALGDYQNAMSILSAQIANIPIRSP